MSAAATVCHTLELDGRTVRLWLLRGSGRRVRIVVQPDGRITVHAPTRMPEDQILGFVRGKSRWIARTLHRVDNYIRLPHPERFQAGEAVAYLGVPHPLVVEGGGRAAAKMSGGSLIVRVPDPTDGAAAQRAVDRWLKARAGEVFERVLARHLTVASRFGIPRPSWSLRRMQRRWGSCGRDGRIVLNVRLVQTPLECIEYVIMHELCHLKHHHHGGDFYALLTQVMPDWPRRKELLSKIVVG
ncbi:MAG: SprT family zinc-dependent metalloprotease [Candidatus Aminicenantes bacterium]|nr:SprT family zinc-dependent metalloprotease [Candidatus Aminicenantes bacterium]